MQAHVALGNHNASARVTLPDTLCKDRSPWLKNSAHRPNVTSALPSANRPTTLASSSAALLSLSVCFCGLFWETALWVRKTRATPPTSPLKRLSRPRPLTQWHQPRLTLSPRPLPIRSRLRLLTQSCLLRLTRHLPRLRQHLPTRNTGSLRAGNALILLGGHRVVSALFPHPQGPVALASNLPTGMTLC